ncbi:inovirus Gp2 family protein [Mariprofundus erugo]|uniref:YagK/YfjJ domain-containing protein n=1 Tax=Mariprofundus erugo TaxID=2528639 RepID=UPI0010FE7098|nr:inovirus-type Gp2 protein [Mariprofundus erugo]TLS77913.1 inovirus Gp2 family protein [Mariprofundus erugo]
MLQTNNRKTVLEPDVQTFKGYPVNAAKSGLYRELLEAIIGQLEACLAHHRRLLVVRFDLHSHGFSAADDNTEISRFMKRIVQWVSRTYSTAKVGTAWVRERERAKQQHYHCALMIDGNKIRHPKKLLKAIKEKWEMNSPDNHMPHISKPYHFADKDSGLADSVYRLSYMAKPRGTGYRPDQVKDYGTSRIKPPQGF